MGSPFFSQIVTKKKTAVVPPFVQTSSPQPARGSALPLRLRPQGRCTEQGEVAPSAGTLVGWHRQAAPEHGREGRMPGTLGGQHPPRRLLREHGSPARGPGSRLPDGGRFLLSRLTARLNIAAVARGGRRSSRAARQLSRRTERRRRPRRRRSSLSTAPARPPPPGRPPHRPAPRGALGAPYPPRRGPNSPASGPQAGQGGPG